MRFVVWKMCFQNIYVYLNTKNRDYSSCKIFNLMIKYSKNVRYSDIIIEFYTNFVKYCSN